MSIDIIIFQWIHGLAGTSAFLDYLGVFFARYLPFVLVGILVSLAMRSPRYRLVALKALVAAGIARFGVVVVIRMLVHRARPFVSEKFALIVPDPSELYGSFPSGHAAFFFALSMMVWLHNRRLGWYFFAASALNGVGRIFVGVHWPSDILGGAAIGILVAYGVHALFLRSYTKIV